MITTSSATSARQRVELADRAEQADRGRDGGGAEHERDAGGDERAERDQQDDQHAGRRRWPRAFLPSLRVLGGDRLGRRGVAELLDAHAGMGVLDGGHGGERLRRRASRACSSRAGQREVHDDRAAVLGDGVGAVGASSGLSISVTPSIRLEAADDVLDGGGDLRIVGLDRALALHEHLLAGLVGEARAVDDHVAALGLAAARRRVVEVVLADLAADARWRGRRTGSSRGWPSCGAGRSIDRRALRGCRGCI